MIWQEMLVNGQWKHILLIRELLEVVIIITAVLTNGVGKGFPCSIRGLAPVSNCISQTGFRIALYL